MATPGEKASASPPVEPKPAKTNGHGPDDARVKALEERVKALEEERGRAKEEANELRDKFLRARADYDNLVRRSGKEAADSAKAAKGALLLKIIAVVETMERAIHDLEKTAPAHAKGFKLVLEEKRKLLKEEGVKEIECLHQQFNYRYHQAVETVETAEHKEGTVTDVVQRGYLLHGEILRPALVKVAAAPKKAPVKEAEREAAGQKA